MNSQFFANKIRERILQRVTDNVETPSDSKKEEISTS